MDFVIFAVFPVVNFITANAGILHKEHREKVICSSFIILNLLKMAT